MLRLALENGVAILNFRLATPFSRVNNQLDPTLYPNAEAPFARPASIKQVSKEV